MLLGRLEWCCIVELTGLTAYVLGFVYLSLYVFRLQSVFMLPTPIAVTAGDTLLVRTSHDDDCVWFEAALPTPLSTVTRHTDARPLSPDAAAAVCVLLCTYA